MLFIYFQFLDYFNKAFVKNVRKKLSFFNMNFQNPFQVAVYYRILEFQTLCY